jgi:hypothetical protein
VHGTPLEKQHVHPSPRRARAPGGRSGMHRPRRSASPSPACAPRIQPCAASGSSVVRDRLDHFTAGEIDDAEALPGSGRRRGRLGTGRERRGEGWREGSGVAHSA